MGKLLTHLVRRIEKILNGSIGVRPTIPPPGTNHEDDSAQWTINDIYQGEQSLDLNGGRLYTSDGVEPIELNTENAILSGLVLRNSEVSSRYLSISEGEIRINGRVYHHTPPIDVTSTEVHIDTNTTGYGRIDLILASGNTDVYNSDVDLYVIHFSVIRGTVSSSPTPPTVPTGFILIGFVYVPPQNLSITTLYPRSVSLGSGSKFPLFSETTESFIQRSTDEVWNWTTNSLLFEGQIVKLGDILYRVGITHQSDGVDIINDMNAGMIVDIGHATDDTIERFSHIGIFPTDGEFSDGVFDWNSTTRILDAFDDLNEQLSKMSPDEPPPLSSISLGITSPTEFSARKRTDGTVKANIINGYPDVEVRTSDIFWPADIGRVRALFDSVATGYIDLEPSEHPPESTTTVTGANLELTLVKNDAYVDDGIKEGFFNGLDATIVYNSSVLSPTRGIAHSITLEYTDINANITTSAINIYFDNLSVVPTITGITDILGSNIVGNWSGKYVSGVPVLQPADTIEFDFIGNHLITEFFNSSRLVTITSEYLTENVLSYTSDYLTENIPFTNGQALNFTDVICTIPNSTITGLLEFDITPYKANDAIGTVNTITTNIIVDKTIEVGVRHFAGTALYPATGYGALYNSEQSQQSLKADGNAELQLYLGKYRYPTDDYTSLPLDNSGSPISGPDYSSGISGTRWTLFDLGTITDLRFVKLLIKSSSNITDDWTTGLTMTDGFHFQIKIEGVTGWIDGNSPYTIGDPINNGDGGLDVRNSTPIIRRITFGTQSHTGKLYVRVGIDFGSLIEFESVELMSNSDVVASDATNFVQLYDIEAPPSTMYWSTDQQALVYKNDAGDINFLLPEDIVSPISNGVPDSSDSSGIEGDLCWDSDFLYLCVGPNTWRRIPLLTW